MYILHLYRLDENSEGLKNGMPTRGFYPPHQEDSKTETTNRIDGVLASTKPNDQLKQKQTKWTRHQNTGKKRTS